MKLGDFVNGARGLLRHFVWKVLIANLRGAETIFYSSTHRPTIRVRVRARARAWVCSLIQGCCCSSIRTSLDRLHAHTNYSASECIHTSFCAFATVLSRLITNRPSKMEVCDGRFKLFRCAGPDTHTGGFTSACKRPPSRPPWIFHRVNKLMSITATLPESMLCKFAEHLIWARDFSSFWTVHVRMYVGMKDNKRAKDLFIRYSRLKVAVFLFSAGT